MPVFQKVKPFLGSLSLLVVLNLLIKPIWIFGIDREVQNRAGLSDYGTYFALMNLSMVLNFMLDLGITAFVNREVAAQHSDSRSLAEKALSYKFFLSFLYTGSMFLMAWLTGVANLYMLILMICLQILVSLLLFLRASLTASGLFWQDAVISILDKFLIIIIAGLWLFLHKDQKVNMLDFVWLQVITVSVTLFVAYLFLKNKLSIHFFQLPKLKKETIAAGLPYALNYFFMTALMRGDGFLVERLSGPQDAGIYAAAFRLIDTVNMMGFLFAAFLVSYIAREGINKETGFVLRLSRGFLLIPAVFIATAGWFYAEDINEILYHTSSVKTTSVIQILLLCLPALALVHIYGSVLTASGEILLFRNISGIFAVLILIVDKLLIPLLGIEAAAWTAVAFQSIYALTVMGYAIARKGLGLYWFDILLISATGLILWICLFS